MYHLKAEIEIFQIWFKRAWMMLEWYFSSLNDAWMIFLELERCLNDISRYHLCFNLISKSWLNSGSRSSNARQKVWISKMYHIKVEIKIFQNWLKQAWMMLEWYFSNLNDISRAWTMLEWYFSVSSLLQSNFKKLTQLRIEGSNPGAAGKRRRFGKILYISCLLVLLKPPPLKI
jgi:hypothetical protein